MQQQQEYPNKKQCLWKQQERPNLLDCLPDVVLEYILEFVNNDIHSMLRLTWLNKFWRNFLLCKGDELWCSMLVNKMNSSEVEVDASMCRRWCNLSGMDCHGLSMVVVASSQRRIPSNNIVFGVDDDARNLGIVTFFPQRVQSGSVKRLQKACNDELEWYCLKRLQQACNDAVDWCVALNQITGFGKFLWQNDRARLMITYLGECQGVHGKDRHQFAIHGQSVWTWNSSQREDFFEEFFQAFKYDGGQFYHLSKNAPQSLWWMHCNYDREGFVSEQITRADLSAIIESNCSLTMGWVEDTESTCFSAAQPGSLARKLNPMARYVMHSQYVGRKCYFRRGVLEELLFVSIVSPNETGSHWDILNARGND